MKLIDTDVLIDHFHGNRAAQKYLSERFEAGEPLVISAITVAEILSGMRPGEERRTAWLLHQFRVVSVDEAVARQAGRFVREYRCGLTDALIAATAFLLGAELITRNLRHYPMPEILVSVPYERGQ